MLNTVLNPAVSIPALINHVQNVHADLSQLADDSQLQGWDRAYMVNGGVVADLAGLRSLAGAYYGEDPYTLEKWSTATACSKGRVKTVRL